MKPKQEYPHTKTSIAHAKGYRGKALEMALPPPDWTSKNGKVKRWRDMPEMIEVSAAYGPLMRHEITFGTPKCAWAIGPTDLIVKICKEYIRRAFEIKLGKEREFFQAIATSHGLTP